MNNMINVSRKLQRARLERNIVAESKKLFPNVEQYLSSHRYPTLPKIVVYSASSHSDSFLNKIFPFYQTITPSLTAETDDVIARRIADDLVRVSQEADEEEHIRYGFLLKGFPFNTNQALLLDRYLNGVNLALHLKTSNESSDYLQSIQSLLGYYDERGTLLELQHSEEGSADQLENALEEIRIKIKRSI